MSRPKQKAKKAQKSWQRNPIVRTGFYILIIGFDLAILLTASGFTFAATKEQHDVFCSSCHTQPESTFYQRSLGNQSIDLATAHKVKQVRCIDCHSGEGVLGRVEAEWLGAHNALAYYTDTAIQPAKLTHPIGDVSCIKCHQDVSLRQDMNNHFHVFLARWQILDPNAATCVSCHQGHSTDGNPQIMFLNEANTRAVCEECHRFLGAGG